MKRIFAHIGFSMAVCLIVLNLIEYKYVYVITAGLAIIFVASLVIDKFRKALAVPVCLGSALFACIVFITVMICTVNVQSNLVNKTLQTQFYITELPEKIDDCYVYEAKTVSIEENGAPQNIKIRVKSDTVINAQPYQVVSASLTFYKTGDNAYSSYGKWGEGIYLSSKIKSFYNVSDENVFSLNKYILKIRKGIISTIKDNLGEETAALAIALLTGDKSYLPDDVYNYFKMAGATHIMAVSGLHLTVISTVFLFIFKKLKVNDRIIAVLTIIICFFCAGIAGFSKSVVRAAIMMSILMTGNLLKRRGDTLNSLGFAVAVICLNPFAVSDVGAILSVLSVLSLVTLYPVLITKVNHSYSDKTDFKTLIKNALAKVIKSSAISLCVTVFTLPAMFVFFGYVSISGILSNILLVPIGSVSMILSLAVSIFSKIQFMSGALSFVTNKIIDLLIFFAEKFAELDALVSIDNIIGISVAGVILVIGICFIIGNRRLVKPVSVLCSIIFAAGCVLSFIDSNNSKMLVCENGGVVVTCGDTTIVAGVDTKSDYYAVRDYLFSRSANIDVLYISDYSDVQYALELDKGFYCNSVAMPYFIPQAVDCCMCNQIIVAQYDYEYYQENNDDSTFFIDDGNFCIIADDTIISLGKSDLADVCIYDDKIYDNVGTIDLSDGNVLYNINDDGYSVRRLDSWQK